ncbi:hypothetical protein Tdes44962_MAKER08452 [Teratosphaeria destructans]|uniref:Uncharacterized protein n=1 Tax=Teratosphaeria destructans TaxID=418781 RepID=A0A9W7SWQ4_9PEZI|nr:hypothetical protein Tdes44962_MAKER08452 [Teratosphaeria destructans]
MPNERDADDADDADDVDDSAAASAEAREQVLQKLRDFDEEHVARWLEELGRVCKCTQSTAVVDALQSLPESARTAIDAVLCKYVLPTGDKFKNATPKLTKLFNDHHWITPHAFVAVFGSKNLVNHRFLTELVSLAALTNWHAAYTELVAVHQARRAKVKRSTVAGKRIWTAEHVTKAIKRVKEQTGDRQSTQEAKETSRRKRGRPRKAVAPSTQPRAGRQLGPADRQSPQKDQSPRSSEGDSNIVDAHQECDKQRAQAEQDRSAESLEAGSRHTNNVLADHDHDQELAIQAEQDQSAQPFEEDGSTSAVAGAQELDDEPANFFGDDSAPQLHSPAPDTACQGQRINHTASLSTPTHRIERISFAGDWSFCSSLPKARGIRSSITTDTSSNATPTDPWRNIFCPWLENSPPSAADTVNFMLSMKRQHSSSSANTQRLSKTARTLGPSGVLSLVASPPPMSNQDAIANLAEQLKSNAVATTSLDMVSLITTLLSHPSIAVHMHGDGTRVQLNDNVQKLILLLVVSGDEVLHRTDRDGEAADQDELVASWCTAVLDIPRSSVELFCPTRRALPRAEEKIRESISSFSNAKVTLVFREVDFPDDSSSTLCWLSVFISCLYGLSLDTIDQHVWQRVLTSAFGNLDTDVLHLPPENIALENIVSVQINSAEEAVKYDLDITKIHPASQTLTELYTKAIPIMDLHNADMTIDINRISNAREKVRLIQSALALDGDTSSSSSSLPTPASIATSSRSDLQAALVTARSELECLESPMRILEFAAGFKKAVRELRAEERATLARAEGIRRGLCAWHSARLAHHASMSWAI